MNEHTTTTHNAPARSLTATEKQAYAWMRKVASGEITHAEGAALKRWCAEHPDNLRAFTQARSSWQQLKVAGEDVLARNPQAAQGSSRKRALAAVGLSQRRLFLGGAFTAAAAAGAVVIAPTWGLLPSIAQWGADYRTSVGERRELALASSVQVTLNTRSSMTVWNDPASGMDLMSGEAAIDLLQADQAFAVNAGGGKTTGRAARFEVQYVDAGVCVTCLQGQVHVSNGATARLLAANQQVVYDAQRISTVAALVPSQLPTWREGFLRFVDTPLGEVIDQINRYRAGKVMLVNNQLATNVVTGRFRTDALDKAIAQIQVSLNLNVRSLPGNVVLLS